MPRVFEHSVRVPYAHVDQMGVVYYANYFVYFEMARAEMLREVGLPYTEMEASGVLLPVVEAHCEYRKSAHFDDLVEIRTTCTRLTGVRLRIEYEVRKQNEAIASGHTVHVCMSPEGKVLRPPASLKALVSGDTPAPPET